MSSRRSARSRPREGALKSRRADYYPEDRAGGAGLPEHRLAEYRRQPVVQREQTGRQHPADAQGPFVRWRRSRFRHRDRAVGGRSGARQARSGARRRRPAGRERLQRSEDQSGCLHRGAGVARGAQTATTPRSIPTLMASARTPMSRASRLRSPAPMQKRRTLTPMPSRPPRLWLSPPGPFRRSDFSRDAHPTIRSRTAARVCIPGRHATAPFHSGALTRSLRPASDA